MASATMQEAIDPCRPPSILSDGLDELLLPVAGPSMLKLLEVLRVFARQEETILLTGPSGAGKSRLAAWCHSQSRRRSGPFQAVDLLSVPEDMQMAEMFGWKRGAFTGALRDQEGCVALSEGGTLFIDEIDKLSRKTQAGLLVLLETRRYRVLGEAGQQQRADVRFIVATNADLRAEVAEGRFREDLHFRLNVLPFRVPPLSERRDEIVPWAKFMLRRCRNETPDAGEVDLSDEAGELLTGEPWPGNLRQLDNVLRRAYALALSEASDEQQPLRVELRHVQRALAFDADVAAPSLMANLRRTARDFIDQACCCEAQGRRLALDHTDAFRGLVLDAGVRKLGNLKRVFQLVGADIVLRSSSSSASRAPTS